MVNAAYRIDEAAVRGVGAREPVYPEYDDTIKQVHIGLPSSLGELEYAANAVLIGSIASLAIPKRYLVRNRKAI
jgi:hypothetical protein